MAGLWGRDLRVGTAFMDGEHDELIGVLVALEERAVAGDPVACRKLLDDFRAQVEAHFVHEEALMSEHAFYGTRAHAAQHALFLHRLDQLYEDPALVRDPRKVIEFFQTWFALHTVDSDQPLAQWLHGKGLTAGSVP